MVAWHELPLWSFRLSDKAGVRMIDQSCWNNATSPFLCCCTSVHIEVFYCKSSSRWVIIRDNADCGWWWVETAILWQLSAMVLNNWGSGLRATVSGPWTSAEARPCTAQFDPDGPVESQPQPVGPPRVKIGSWASWNCWIGRKDAMISREVIVVSPRLQDSGYLVELRSLWRTWHPGSCSDPFIHRNLHPCYQLDVSSVLESETGIAEGFLTK